MRYDDCGQPHHQTTHRPAVLHHLAREAELPDECRYEASVEVCARPVPVRGTGVARQRPREVEGDHRPQLSQPRNEVDPRGVVLLAPALPWLDDLEAAREHPKRLAGTATAFASIIDAMFITQRRTNEVLDAVRMPVLVVGGSDDPLVDPSSLRQHARRPNWTPRPIDDVGHLLPVEAPDLCAQAIGPWLADTGA